MRSPGRGTRRRPFAFAGAVVALALAGAACSAGGEPSVPTPVPRSTVRPRPPVVIGPADVAAWVATWKDAFHAFANDVSAVIGAARGRDLAALRDALARLPGDAHEAVRKIDTAGAAPPGFR